MEPFDTWFSPDQLEEQLARQMQPLPPTTVNERLLHDLRAITQEDSQRLERLRARLLNQAAENVRRPPVSIEDYQNEMSGLQSSSGRLDVSAGQPAFPAGGKRTSRLLQLALGLVALLIVGSMPGIFVLMRTHQPLQSSIQHPISTIAGSAASSSIPIHGSAAFVLDSTTGQTLVDINSHARLPLADTVRLMTAVVAIENGNLDQSVTVSQNELQEVPQGSRNQLIAGDRFTLRALITALLLSGGNDATVVVAHSVAGNTAGFVTQMNDEAHQLQLYDTHFNNPYGTPGGDAYSSAADLAHLTQYALQLTEFASIVRMPLHLVPAVGRNQAYQWISSPDVSNIHGRSSGYNARAGACIVFSSRRADGHILIGVELGAPSIAILNVDIQLLLRA